MSGPAPTIALIPKNKNEAIRIALGEFKGAHFVDVRVVVPQSDVNGKTIFTSKGVAVPIRRIPALIDALKAALIDAQRLGLFDDQPASKNAA